MHAGLLAALVVGALVTGCGDEEPGAGQTVDLKLSVANGKGTVARATLRCDGDAQGTGFLAKDPDAHCRTAQGLERLLTAKAPGGRVCTQVYGGPQTAHVTGSIAGKPVDVELARRNGCEIADWDRAAPLLAPSGIRPGP